MTVRWPTGFMNAGPQPGPLEAVEQAERGRGLAPVLPGGGEIELAHAPLAAVGGLALDQGDRVAQPRQRLGVDRVRLEIRPEPLHDVGDEPEEDRRVGLEELRLVVVADERQAALEDAPLLDMGDLGREVVALDPVGVVQEVQGVVDRQPEPRPPGDEPLVDLGRDPDLGDLLEDLGRDRQQPDERRARPAGRA